MSDFEFVPGGVCAAAGFLAAGIHCGVRKNRSKKDLALIYSETPCAAAAVYTQNKVFGAPITVTRAHLQNGRAQAVICNSGNANTCNADGVEKANAMAKLAAAAAGVAEEDVIVASTGVIGQVLDLAPIKAGMPALAAALSPDGSDDAAQAIMTTDLRKKELAVRFTLGGKPVCIGAIAKGSGMIHPNMATMLAFFTTDAAISPAMLQAALSAAVADSFNMISIDGDSSTNDTVAVLANGRAGNPAIEAPGADYERFCAALAALAKALSRQIARDGEGATKLLECALTGARTGADARTAAKAVIASSLVKCAMFGADANWGRVLCALGYCGADTGADRVDVAFSSAAGRVEVCRGSAGVDFSEPLAKQVLGADEVTIEVNLHEGEAAATAWGCDLTYDYVKINGDYRT